MPDIFLSYNREDQAIARRFAEAFAGQGLDVWWDVGLKSGEAYDQVTEKALREAKAVVVLWSKRSVESRWCRAEATLADRNKTLVPAMVEPCERPIMFELVQTAELSHWKGDTDDRTWLGFLADVRRFVDRDGARPTPPAASLAEIAHAYTAPAETLLAVLPFDNLSDDREMTFFSDGVSEDILGRLSRGSKLKVIGKTSSFQFRGSDKPKAAANLKATHVLDGSIRRAGGKVRIAAHLTEVAGHTTLWADKYDRGLEDVFAVQDEISEAIANELNAAFFPQKAAKIDPETYDLYLRAVADAYSVEGMHRAISTLETVTRQAPDFADGWGLLARNRAILRWDKPLAERPEMKRAAEAEAARSLALDPDNIHATVAQFHFLDPFGDFLAQDAVMDRLQRIGGTSADALFMLTWYTECLGRTNEAVEIGRRARDLDPMNGWANTGYGQTLWRSGRYAEGRAVMEHTLRLWPDMHYNTATLALCYAHQQDWAALDSILDPARYPLRELGPIISLVAAIRDESPEPRRRLLERMRSRSRRSGHIDTSGAPIIAHYGFVGEVHEILETSRFGPSGGPDDLLGVNAYRTHLLFPHASPELRDDPRFVKVCARLGLVEYWLATQKWPDCADTVPYDFRAACEKHRHAPKDRFGV